MRRHLRSVPLRLRLVAISVLLVAAALAATAIATNVVLERYLVNRVDDQLAQTSRMFGRDPDRDSPPPAQPQGRPELPSPVFVQTTAPDGTVVAQRADSSKDTGELPELPELTAARAADVEGAAFTVPAKDGSGRWRVLVRSADDGVSTTVAIELDDVDSTTGRLATIELALAALVLALLGVVSYYVVRSSLRPLVEVERTAEAIAAGDLTARVPDLDPRTEVGGLSAALNAMLGQIEEAVGSREAAARAAHESEQRMRRFVADASHELRTPLTSIRGFAELYGQGGAADQEAVDRFMLRIAEESERMGQLVEDMLTLARLDRERAVELAPVELTRIAEDAVQDARVVAPDRPIVCSLGASSVLVSGDDARLRQVVANLVRNALVHTPAGTSVTVSVESSGGFGVVAVSDRGPGIAPEDSDRIFERFYRAEPSRERRTGGTGLGLSIVAAIVASHHGTVDVTTVPGRGSTFTVRLPLAH